MHTTSLELIGQMRLGADQASWNRFVDLYAPLLYQWNRAAGLQPADAQEVVQEVLLVVFQRLGHFEHRRPGAFRAWLSSITSHKIKNLRRRGPQRGGRLSLDGVDALPDRNADFAWAERYAEDIFFRACGLARPLVSPKVWDMFNASFIERKSIESVALSFGVSRNAVYIAQSRCLSRVRSIIGRYLDDSFQAPIISPSEIPADGIAT